MQWWGALFALLLIVARMSLDHIHTKGRTAALVTAGFLALGVIDFIRAKSARDRREDTNRPATHTVTR